VDFDGMNESSYFPRQRPIIVKKLLNSDSLYGDIHVRRII